MARGRKAQPAAVKEAKGNPGKRPIPKAEAEVPDHTADVPAWLTDREAVRVWKELSQALRGINLLKATDHVAFSRYCYYVGLWIKETRRLKGKPLTYTTTSKHVGKMQRINQSLVVVLRLEDKIVKLEEQLGATPASRQSLLQRLAAQPQLPFPKPDEVPADHTPGTAVDPLLGGLQSKTTH